MAITDYLQGINNAISGQKADVNTATQDLSTLQTGAGSLPSKLKEALNTKLNNNTDLINQQADTMQTYFNAGPTAREKYANIWDPFKKASLVQQERSMALRPYDVLSGVLENRMGNVSDIINSGVQGWQGMVNAATTKLSAAQTNLQTALQAYQEAAQQQSAADQLEMQRAAAEEAKRQFGITSGMTQQGITNQSNQFAQNYALDKYKTYSSGGSGGGGTPITFPGIIPPTPTTTTNVNKLIEPPFSAVPGTKKEYPPKSGVVWTAGANGQWI